MKVTPASLDTASHDLANINTALTQDVTTAATHTTAIVSAGADEVSAAVATLFNTYGQDWQAISKQAEAAYQQFVQNLAAAACAYQEMETGNSGSLGPPQPIGIGGNIFSVNLLQHEFQLGIGEEFYTVQWGWEKLP